MMIPSQVFSLVLLATAATAVTAAPATTPGKSCVELTLPVPVVAANKHYKMPTVDSNVDAVHWALNMSIWTSPKNKSELIVGDVPIRRTFSISAELCVPRDKTDKAGTLQIALQGNAWDKRYVREGVGSRLEGVMCRK
jgi:hypothetical protein